jgi:hypothetical protein
MPRFLSRRRVAPPCRELPPAVVTSVQP